MSQCDFSSVGSKEKGVEEPKDFRPISLVRSLYKLLAKVLANRLKKMVSKVVSSFQNAFVERRQILDVVLIANEEIDSMLKSKNCGVLCKLDIEKSYDHVNWDFLLLGKMGFGQKWINWIRCRWCIPTSFLALVKDTPSFFQSSRGLRQGDLLSLYSFVLDMEMLSCLFKRAKKGSYLFGFKVNS